MPASSPEEILSHVFTLACRPIYPFHPDGVESILRVSKFWRQTAHRTVALWSAIGFKVREPACTPEQLERYLHRSNKNTLEYPGVFYTILQPYTG